jgi:hypothetical protein
VIVVDSSVKRKTYWQSLSFTTTSTGSWSTFLRHTWQPFWILFTVPGVAYSSCVYAVLLAWSTVMTAALSTYMLDAPYNFSATSIGLMNLAPFIGTTIGSLICGPISDWMVLRLARRKGGIYEPEMRYVITRTIYIASEANIVIDSGFLSHLYLSKSPVPFGLGNNYLSLMQNFCQLIFDQIRLETRPVLGQRCIGFRHL